jgi:hypothetical protein
MSEELPMSMTVSRFLKYVLGDLEKAPIYLEEARLLELLKVPSIHVQFYTLDEPIKPLELPIVWQQKYWHQDVLRRRKLKEKHDLERLACNRMRENIQRAMKHFMRPPYSLPEKLAESTVERMVINKDVSLLKTIGINMEELNEAEWQAAHDYIEMLKQRNL